MKLCDHSIEKSASYEFESFVLNNVHVEWMNEKLYCVFEKVAEGKSPLSKLRIPTSTIQMNN